MPDQYLSCTRCGEPGTIVLRVALDDDSESELIVECDECGRSASLETAMTLAEKLRERMNDLTEVQVQISDELVNRLVYRMVDPPPFQLKVGRPRTDDYEPDEEPF